MPKHPRGLYRSLYQALDALGHPRVYPATLMQCAGRIIAGDHWWSADWLLMLQYLSGMSFPFCNQDQTGAPRTYAADAALLLANGGNAPGCVWHWAWYLVADDTRPEFWTAWLLQVSGAGAWYRLRDMAVFAVGSQPWEPLPMPTPRLAISQGGPFGSPWLNAI